MDINDNDNILEDEDYRMWEYDLSQGPILSSPLNAKEKFESYNEWHCFSTDSIELECTDINYNDKDKQVPTIIAKTDTLIYNFDLSPEIDWDCPEIIHTWNDLFEDERSICVYAAYLQDLEFDNSNSERNTLWYISRIKTSGDYWLPEDK